MPPEIQAKRPQGSREPQSRRLTDPPAAGHLFATNQFAVERGACTEDNSPAPDVHAIQEGYAGHRRSTGARLGKDTFDRTLGKVKIGLSLQHPAHHRVIGEL